MADYMLGTWGERQYYNLTSYAGVLSLDRRTLYALVERSAIRPAAMIGFTRELLFDGRDLKHDQEVANAVRRQR